MQRQSYPSGPISGHIYLKRGKRGASWCYHARLPYEVRRRLGPAWLERGRPAAGYFTKRTAQAALDALLTDARRGKLDGLVKTGATFADAAAEWLCYVEYDRKRRPSTISDYKGVIEHALRPEFGELRLEAVTTGRIDAYRARLVEDGRLSPRTINKRLVVMHGILARAQRVYGLATNPAALVDRQPLRRSGEFAVLSPAEVEVLARAAESEQDATLFRVAPSPACGSAKYGRCAGATWISATGSSTSGGTTRTAPSAHQSRARCEACR